MTECTNIEAGRMLHDYELDMLSAEEKQQFELHLYDCDHCLYQVREFISESRIIKFDPEAQAIIKDMAVDSDEVKPDRIQEKPSNFYRFLIAAIIVLVIGIPAYWYLGQPQWLKTPQTLELLPSRAGGNDIIYLEKGGEVKISFYVADHFPGKADLIISNITGDTVVYTPGFEDFNDKGMGSITLPVSEFSDGHYMLTIKPDKETGLEERFYMFRAK